jgi:hypothetical protein
MVADGKARRGPIANGSRAPDNKLGVAGPALRRIALG